MNPEWSLLAPEYILAGWAAMVIAVDLFFGRVRKDYLSYLAALGALVAAVVSLIYINDDKPFGALLQIDNYATFFRVFFCLIAFFACLISTRFVNERVIHAGEYYALILVTTIGGIYMAAAEELLTAYIGLELLSFSLYVLTSFLKFDLRSNEGGLKYMLLGAFSSAILLYGISLIYGVTGSTSFSEIAQALSGDTDDLRFPMLLGLVLIISGLGFKVAAVPFHMWTPDAYEGAPLPITAFISAISKSAGFALFLKLFAEGFMPVIDEWRWIVAGLAALTMIFGNLVAIQQRNIKRLLAYSSIGQVGFLMMGIAAISPEAASAMLLHLAGYVISNLAVFVAIIIYYNQTGKENIDEFAGLAERSPFVAVCLGASLFSLAGMPLFAGFVTKFILFQSAAEQDMLWLAGIAVLMSFVSLYYYLMVIKEMYLGQPEMPTRFPIVPLDYAALAVLTAGVFFVGLYPQPFFDATANAADLLFAGTSATSVSGGPTP
jgi:NADH-quinone oxidoreductase subunit N